MQAPFDVMHFLFANKTTIKPIKPFSRRLLPSSGLRSDRNGAGGRRGGEGEHKSTNAGPSAESGGGGNAAQTALCPRPRERHGMERGHGPGAASRRPIASGCDPWPCRAVPSGRCSGIAFFFFFLFRPYESAFFLTRRAKMRAPSLKNCSGYPSNARAPRIILAE